MVADAPESAARLACFSIGDWIVDPRSCLLTRGDAVRRLRPQLVDLLACLAKRPGQLVLKEEILAEVWPGQFVADSGLTRCIAELRQALEDDAHQPRYIEATRKRGYRLVAPVVWVKRRDGEAEPARTEAAEAGPANAGGEERRERAAAADAVPFDRSVPLELTSRPLRRIGLWAVPIAVALVVVGLVMLTRSPAGVLTEQDAVLLAFENLTGDAVFDETIPLAMSIQLEQSPYLALLSADHVRETLQMMRRAPDTPITREVGLEVCERVGARAVIVTSVATLGSRYAIGLEAIACGEGHGVLVRRQEMVEAKEQVLDGIQRGAEAIRRAVGESAASVRRYGTQAVQATTGSIDALRELRRGDVARELGQGTVALDHYRQAVLLDPDFALAHLRRGTAASVHGTEAERDEALEKAYALKDKVTLPERLEIEARYFTFAGSNEARMFDAWEQLVRHYPRRAALRRALAEACLRNGRFDAALTEALEARRLEPKSPASMVTLGRTHLCLNRIPEAIQAAEEGLSAGGTSPWLHYILFQAGLATEDEALLARARTWAGRNPDLAVPYILEADAEDAMSRGRLKHALALLAEWERAAVAAGQPRQAAVLRLRMARYEALCGLRGEALRRVEAERRHEIDYWLAIDAVKVAVSAGDFALAAQLLDEAERKGMPPTAQPAATFARAYRAAIHAHDGRIDDALGALLPLEPLDLALNLGFIPLYERAQVHLLARDWPRARAAYEKILAHPTIDPGRKLVPLAQLGLARTLARAGDMAASRKAYEQFFARWKNADAGLPLLAEARAEYEALRR
jgi:eukaryotic-like serine/threonine-protein kinase